MTILLLTHNFRVVYLWFEFFYREISWQDFKRQLLEAGVVDKIIVTNKSTAR